ncbi:MAG: AAA family ATPase [Saccharofermentanales bacterium]
MKILKIAFNGVRIFDNDHFEINLIASDKVTEDHDVFQLYETIYSLNVVALTGINASGKTSALKLINSAIDILINDVGLNEEKFLAADIFKDNIEITIWFFHNDKFYELKSNIGSKKKEFITDDLNGSHKSYYYIDEELKIKNKSKVTSRKDIFDFNREKIFVKRSKIDKINAQFLREDQSIVKPYVLDSKISLYQMITDVNMNLISYKGTAPEQITNLFDYNIEYLKQSKEDKSYSLKFKNNKTIFKFNDSENLSKYLSSGTIKGENIAVRIINVLRSGGYLLIDELENHLNKQLINVFFEIFSDPAINPKGATLIFSTHYPEILDFIDRKDNVYILRNNDNHETEVVNYSDHIKRIENKKSEIILANIIKGSTPSYESTRNFKAYIRNRINE